MSKTRQIKWSERAFVIEGQVTTELGIDVPIKRALGKVGVTISTDWEAGFPYSAEIGRYEWEAICDEVKAWRQEVQERMKAASTAQRQTCPKCGGPLNGKTCCDDCDWSE